MGATEATNIFSNTKDAKFEAECLLRERMYDDEYGCHSKQFLVKVAFFDTVIIKLLTKDASELLFVLLMANSMR